MMDMGDWMTRHLWKNWPVHNLLAHPVAEVAYWLARPWGEERAMAVFDAIHDATLPPNSARTATR